MLGASGSRMGGRWLPVHVGSCVCVCFCRCLSLQGCLLHLASCLSTGPRKGMPVETAAERPKWCRVRVRRGTPLGTECSETLGTLLTLSVLQSTPPPSSVTEMRPGALLCVSELPAGCPCTMHATLRISHAYCEAPALCLFATRPSL